jgi:hypothetical protein
MGLNKVYPHVCKHNDMIKSTGKRELSGRQSTRPVMANKNTQNSLLTSV